ncbi:MAG: hypothetical protein M1818_003589 [Claussenomyces sp. TS43310]|nr:MAG: hypothetical protein M1818_003589 [Claussenomyces sp. TS43310]
MSGYVLLDPVQAQFHDCFLPVIAAAPAALAACMVLACFVKPLFGRVPQWAKSFAVELPDARRHFSLGSKGSFQGYAAALLILSFVGFLLQMVAVFYPTFSVREVYLSISWAISAIFIATNNPRTTPYSLLVLYTSILASRIILLWQKHAQPLPHDIPAILESFAAFGAIVIILSMPMRESQILDNQVSPAFSESTNRLRSPEEQLNMWQFMTVSWMKPLMAVGSKRQLHDEDVWALGSEFQHQRLHTMFRQLKGSVTKRLLEANGLDLIIISAFGIVELLAGLSVPVLLQQLLRSIEDSNAPRGAAVTYALFSLIVSLVAAQCSVFKLWFSRRAYERSRGEMITMLYEKTLSRKIMGIRIDAQPAVRQEDLLARPVKQDFSSQNYFTRLYQCIWNFKPKPVFKQQNHDHEPIKQPASMGKILNLMRNDVYEIAQRFWEVDTLVTRPLGVFLSLVLLWRLIGWSCIIGVLTVFIAQAINALIARTLLQWERLRRGATDVKLKKVSEFVEAVRHLRWYGWQDAWLSHIMGARQRELNLRIVTSLWSILISFTNIFASGIFPVVAFYAYTTLAGQPLRIDIAFPALQLFTMLETHLREVPALITILLNATVAVQRIEDFMSEPDKLDSKAEPSSSSQLRLKGASFKWPEAVMPVLHNVTLAFPTGLTVICGEVAAGKSALLQSLLGELDHVEGEISRPNEMIGYCAQTPWLQSMSIRDNILFASPYEETRYKQVLEACALAADMANFKHGDLSNIGENGIGLSGGQKARVALARAVYSRAKILLLDDPLSALDHQTAERIVRRCLSGEVLTGRTTILVTHRTEICVAFAKQVVEVSGGTVHVVNPGSKPCQSLTKTLSPLSVEDTDGPADLDKVPDKFLEDEHRAFGGVKASVYWEYIKAGKLRWWFILICTLVGYRLIGVGETYFLKQWGEAYDDPKVGKTSNFFDKLPSPEENVRPWLIGFFLIVTAQSVSFLISQGIMLVIIYSAGRQMFRDVMTRVSHATFRFYDVTPIGRLMNRLTSDISTIDGNISQQFQDVARYGISWISSVIVIASVTPTFLIFVLGLIAGFVFIFVRFLPTSQSLRRLEMVSLSPLMSNFGALLVGLTTVRAFGVQGRFQDQKMDHFYWSLQAWLIYRFDVLASCSTFVLTLLAIYTGVSPGLTAFVLIAASKFVESTPSLCKQYAQLQMDFVSVERVVEMLHLEQESPGSINPPAWWPTSSGDIVFEDVTIRYAAHLDPSLSELSFRIKGGSSTAIIGRTGSGKSTLASTLLATILPESGRILIDKIDISAVDTQALRRRVTFLAQDPVLFPGSMRQNLDPLEEYTDEECDTVLHRICGRYQWSLDTKIDSGGQNLSQGQRQLVGLARALLRRSPIVILDEATASIDMETAMQIQQVLREELKDSTVITIAHRLEAVKNAEYCIVLSEGRLVRQGSAADLLSDGNGGFGDLLHS